MEVSLEETFPIVMRVSSAVDTCLKKKQFTFRGTTFFDTNKLELSANDSYQSSVSLGRLIILYYMVLRYRKEFCEPVVRGVIRVAEKEDEGE